MCSECNEDGMLLPSIESFAKRWKLPKMYYLFYEYFFKPVIGDATWKRRMAENKRLGSIIAEAYTHGVIRNHFFAWLYEYKAKNPSNALRTEYDQVSPGSDQNEEQGQSLMAPLYSGDLDMIQVSAGTFIGHW